MSGLPQMENGREAQVGGEMCRTMHKNDFKKDSPVPYFSFVLCFNSEVWTLLLKILFNGRPSKEKGGRGWQQEVREV